MQSNEGFEHSKWSSEWAFLLAAIAYAIGLGNIWRFSYVVGVNGGGGFIMIYLGCVFLIGLPLLLCDFVIGRRGMGSPPVSIAATARSSGKSTKWSALGWMGLFNGFLVLSYYSVIAGWTIAYFVKATAGDMPATIEESNMAYDGLLGDPWALTFWHTLFIGGVAVVSAFGLQNGIERMVKVAMPIFCLLLLALVGYGAVAGDMVAALQFLFIPRFEDIDLGVAGQALGQAFFSIGMGAGALMIYAAYIPKEVSLRKTGTIIVIGDSLAAMIGGLAIYPLLFGTGLEADQGPGLVFKTLPLALESLPGGLLVGGTFFFLLAVAAYTSALGLLEPVVAWAEEHKGVKRWVSSAFVAGCAWIIGLATVLSFNEWNDFFPLDFIGVFEGKTIFGIFDFAMSNLFLPLSGLGLAVFSGWVLDKKIASEELELSVSSPLFRFWYLMVKWVIPAVMIALLFSLLFTGAEGGG